MASKDEGRLGDDGEGGSESSETDSGSGGIVEEDGGGAIALGETEEGVEERRLTGSSSTDHSNLHLWLNVEVDIRQCWFEVISIAESGVLESNRSFGGPFWRKLRVRKKLCFFLLFKASVSLHSLNTAHRGLNVSELCNKGLK